MVLKRNYDYAWTKLSDRIKRTEGVCGGDVCIRNTRIPVWTLVRYRQLGLTNEEIIEKDEVELEKADLEALIIKKIELKLIE